MIEKRLEDDYNIESALKENAHILKKVKEYGLKYIIIDEDYDVKEV